MLTKKYMFKTHFDALCPLSRSFSRDLERFFRSTESRSGDDFLPLLPVTSYLEYTFQVYFLFNYIAKNTEMKFLDFIKLHIRHRPLE